MSKHIVLSMKGITKRFPGVLANNNISFDLQAGEVHSLLGENGAGKSTLMSILSGLYQPDTGTIELHEKEVRINNPRDAMRLGIGMVYQHFMLIPQFTVVENIMLGMKSRNWPLLDTTEIAKRVTDFASQYSIDIDPYAKVWQLSVGQQQRVEILKALFKKAHILVLDEPTAVLTPQETSELFTMIERYTMEGNAVVFISHKIDEVIEISDRISVLQRGTLIDTLKNDGLNKGHLASLMVGREINFTIQKRLSQPKDPVLSVEHLFATNVRGVQALKDVSFILRSGEILGIAGVDGNGQSELLEVITGLRKAHSGSIKIHGKEVTNQSTRNIMEHSIGHIPEDRHSSGLVCDMNLEENFILQDYYKRPHQKHGILQWKYINNHTNKIVSDFDVRTPSVKVLVRNLSGGNQQKLVLARELHRNPTLLLAMHATRGLDVGAIEYIHKKILQIRDAGTAILYISTELEEILALSDRIAVINHGKIMGIVQPQEVDIQKLGLMMAGSAETQE